MLSTLERYLQSEWMNFFPNQKVPRHIGFAVISSSREVLGGRVILAFADRDRYPTLVIKVARHPSGVPAVDREWRLLQQMYRALPSNLTSSVPRPLCFSTIQQLPVYVQSVVRGQNLKTLVQRGHHSPTPGQVERDLLAMDHWLEDFQKVVPPDGNPAGLIIERESAAGAIVEDARAILLKEAVITLKGAATLVRAAERVDEVFRETRSCWVHGDLWPGNVLVHRGQRGVIDWDALTVGNPWRDRLWYALHAGAVYYARLFGHKDLRDALRATFFSWHPITDVLRTHLQNMARQMAAWGGSYHDYLLVMLASEASCMLNARGRGRVFDLLAADVLNSWLSEGKEVRI